MTYLPGISFWKRGKASSREGFWHTEYFLWITLLGLPGTVLLRLIWPPGLEISLRYCSITVTAREVIEYVPKGSKLLRSSFLQLRCWKTVSSVSRFDIDSLFNLRPAWAYIYSISWRGRSSQLNSSGVVLGEVFEPPNNCRSSLSTRSW